jgi:hypothetical protein
MSGSFQMICCCCFAETFAWQKEADFEMSKKIRNSIGEYMGYKHLADKDLVGRTKFNWTILRPGPLTNEPAVGLAECGIAPFIGLSIPVEFSLLRVGRL